MLIICNNCGNYADGVEIASHLGKCFIKAFGAAAVSYFTKLVLDAATPTRSLADDSLAVIANISEMQCFKYEKSGLWRPYQPINQDNTTEHHKQKI